MCKNIQGPSESWRDFSQSVSVCVRACMRAMGGEYLSVEEDFVYMCMWGWVRCENNINVIMETNYSQQEACCYCEETKQTSCN